MAVLCFGEILWDVFPDKEYIGGASYNVAAHVHKLGAETYIYSRLGDDRLGHNALAKVQGHGVCTDFVQTDREHPTGTAMVTLDERAVPTFTITPDTAYDFIDASEEDIAAVNQKKFDLFYFGTVAQKGAVSRNSLYKILDRCEFKDVFFDINLRKPFYNEEIIKKSLGYATILKINDDELALVGKMFFATEDETSVVSSLYETYPKLHTVLITKGPDGARVYTREDSYYMNYCVSKAVDTVGSGDAFSSGFIVSYLKGDGIREAGRIGNIMGDFVASHGKKTPHCGERHGRYRQDPPGLHTGRKGSKRQVPTVWGYDHGARQYTGIP
jgi:fructokinase